MSMDRNKAIDELREQINRGDLSCIVAVSDGPYGESSDVTQCVKALLKENDHLNELLRDMIAEQKSSSARVACPLAASPFTLCAVTDGSKAENCNGGCVSCLASAETIILMKKRLADGDWPKHRWVKVSERDDLREEMCHLAHDISDVRVELVRATEVLRSASGFATKIDLEKLGDKIMSAIGDWGAKVGPKLDRIQTGLDAVQALVEKLQNTSGAITPEDQALLDQIEQKVDAIASDADSVPPLPPASPV